MLFSLATQSDSLCGCHPRVIGTLGWPLTSWAGSNQSCLCLGISAFWCGYWATRKTRVDRLEPGQHPQKDSVDQVSSLSRAQRLSAMAAGCFILAVAVLPLDVAMSRWWTSDPLPGDLAKFITLSEVFAHGFGVAVLLIAVWLLDPRRRKNWLRLVCSAYGSGLVTHLFKISIGRTRPNAIKPETDVAGTFVGWLPAWTERDWSHFFDRSIQSFPSGHTATAVGLAIGLTYLYPRGRWLFTLLAIAAALQRLQANAHFPSDVLAAAGIACLVGAGLWKNKPSR